MRSATVRLSILLLGALGPSGAGCAAKNYTQYLIEPAPTVNPILEDADGTQLRPLGFGSTTAMTVRWNDGGTLTEVSIPLLASGQRIVIEHSPGSGGVERIDATRLVPPPPTTADRTLEDAYRERGLRVNPDAAEVSLSGTRTKMQDAIADGNYQLALQWCQLILDRYPSHPETLRAQGSILLLMGEREKAIEVYEAAEEVESDPDVRRQLDELQKR
jgi:tetratricopeptide (TPR) repeat protein